MYEPVDGGDRHGWIREYIGPARERLVGRNQKTSALVPLGDQFEQDAGFGLVLAYVRQVTQDNHIETIKPGENGWQLQALPRGLQFLSELARACEQIPVA